MTVFSRDHPFSGYRRAEGEVKDSPESTAVALVAQNAHFAARSPSEVLICTHGQRDRCCGSLGMALHKKLEAMPADTGLVHSRRTSHMGGHRFAPTALVFPEGTAWAFMNPQLLSAITSRTGPIDAALPYYRGCTGLDSGRQQALERAVLREVGWDMLDSARWGEDLGATTLLHVKSSHGQTSSWEADVHIGREVKVPDCGGTVANATKTESELVVSGLRQLA